MAASGVVLPARTGFYTERAESINIRFNEFVTRVRSLREQSKNIENNTFLAHTQALENEIYDLKKIYEQELDNIRSQLDDVIAERNTLNLDANKNGTLAGEFKEK